MKNLEKPLITFMILSFNQEKYISEAIEGAFSQTYNPLEIILSDDCSTDNTFEIIKKMKNMYSGPHKIKINRNKQNVGIGQHINIAMSLAKGEIIIGAAGDDISIPERTSLIYEAWENSDRKAFSIDSECRMIDERGKLINKKVKSRRKNELTLLNFSKTLNNLVLGCTHAWHRDVFKIFGPLPMIIQEDIAIPPRAMLIGNVIHIDKPLVKYRSHSNNLCNSSTEVKNKESIEKIKLLINDRIKIGNDIIRCIKKQIDQTDCDLKIQKLNEYISNINQQKNRNKMKVKIISDNSLSQLYYLLIYVVKYRFTRFKSHDLKWLSALIKERLRFSCQ